MKNVLILNDSYMPLNIVTMKKACKMMVKSGIWEALGRKSEYHIDIIEHYDDDIKSASGTNMVRPAVICIAHFKKPSQKNAKMFAPFSRKGIWLRDKCKCQYCGTNVKLENMHWDHIVPRKAGGQTTWTNIVCACLACNSKKADLSLSKCGMKLLKKPEPVYNKTTDSFSSRERILRKLGKHIPTQWKSYLSWMGINETAWK